MEGTTERNEESAREMGDSFPLFPRYRLVKYLGRLRREEEGTGFTALCYDQRTRANQNDRTDKYVVVRSVPMEGGGSGFPLQKLRELATCCRLKHKNILSTIVS